MDLIDTLGLRPHIEFVSGRHRRAHRRALRRGRAGGRAQPVRGVQPAGDRGDGHRHCARRHRRRRAARGHRHRRRHRAAVPRRATPTRWPRRSRRGLDDPELRARVGAAGRQRVLERWTWRRCAELTVEQYREVLAMPANVAKLRRNGRPAPTWPTADADDPLRPLPRSACSPGDLVLDAGAGFGRHAFELARRGARRRRPRLRRRRGATARATRSRRWSRPARSPPSAFVGVLRGDATRLPFADGTLRRRDHVARCSSTSPTTPARSPSWSACCEPGGTFAATVPSWLPEKINWMLSRRVPRARRRSAATCASTRATELKAKLRAAGLQRRRQPPRPRPALAVLVAEVRRRRHTTTTTRSSPRTGGSSSGTSSEQPRSTRIADRLLSPVLGKSFVALRDRSDDAVVADAVRRAEAA